MDNENNGKVNEGSAENKQAETPKTYTQAEVDALLQKEADKRVTEALKKQERKNAEKIKEAEKLAQMNEAEKFQYQLEQREKAIAEKEKELALAENKNEASKILAEKGLSLALVDFVVAEDAETMNENIKTLDTAFKQSVKLEVEKRLASSTPKKNLPQDKTIDKNAFRRMSMTELTELKQNNPDLYNSLKNS